MCELSYIEVRKTTYYTASFTNCKCYMVRCFVRFFYHLFCYFQDKMEKMSWSLINICVRYFFCKFRILLRGYFFLWINVQIAQRYHFVFHLIIPLFTPSTNKTDHHDITEILLNVALNIINLNQTYIYNWRGSRWWSVTRQEFTNPSIILPSSCGKLSFVGTTFWPFGSYKLNFDSAFVRFWNIVIVYCPLSEN